MKVSNMFKRKHWCEQSKAPSRLKLGVKPLDGRGKGV